MSSVPYPLTSSGLRRRKRRPVTRRFQSAGPGTYLFLILVIAASVFPLYWSFVIATHDNSAIGAYPPVVTPGGHFWTYLNALGETLAISLLGTLLGALFALPLGVLAARNVVAAALLRLPIKRFFDAVRFGVKTGRIGQHAAIVRIDLERAQDPLLRAVDLSELEEGAAAK